MKVIVDIDSEETKNDMTKYAFRSRDEILNWLRRFPEYTEEEGDETMSKKDYTQKPCPLNPTNPGIACMSPGYGCENCGWNSEYIDSLRREGKLCTVNTENTAIKR